jgi:hypothetical protein
MADREKRCTDPPPGYLPISHVRACWMEERLEAKRSRSRMDGSANSEDFER